MSDKKFNHGDVVYHKANNLRMVVTAVYEGDLIACRYVDPRGVFENGEFNSFELSSQRDPDLNVKTQLESK